MIVELLQSASEVPDLARTVAPVLLLDRSEPFRPLAIGVTEFTRPGPSPSSRFHIMPKGAHCFEYATYWDWDIGHLLDLEHVWVHLDAAGTVIAVDATFHGSMIEVDLQLQGNRPVIWCEAGKHAHFRNRGHRDGMASATHFMTAPDAGRGGVHTSNRFADGFGEITAYHHRLAGIYLKRLAFSPALGRGVPFDMAEGPLCVWPALGDLIPRRVPDVLARLELEMPHIRALFLDCGDTLVDEGTEVKREDGSDVVIRADLIDGAAELITTLKARGYRLCLVADGPRETFENVLGAAGLWEAFEAHVISGDIGVRKPDLRMFSAAMEAMELDALLAPQVPMIGNNLDRDIAGANRAGHPGIFFNWSDRRRRVPKGPEDTPIRQFTRLSQCAALIDHLEVALDQAIPT